MHGGEIGAEQRADGLRHGREHLVSGRLLCDEHGDPPQSRLLLDENAQRLAGLGVRDRGRDQLGELADPRLDVCRQRIALARSGDHRAPQSPLDHDRSGDGGAHAQYVRHGGDRAGRIRPVVHAGGLACSMHRRDDVLALEREAGAQRRRIPRSLRLREERGRPVTLEAKQPDRLRIQDPRRLLGDRDEDLDRRQTRAPRASPLAAAPPAPRRAPSPALEPACSRLPSRTAR